MQQCEAANFQEVEATWLCSHMGPLNGRLWQCSVVASSLFSCCVVCFLMKTFQSYRRSSQVYMMVWPPHTKCGHLNLKQQATQSLPNHKRVKGERQVKNNSFEYPMQCPGQELYCSITFIKPFFHVTHLCKSCHHICDIASGSKMKFLHVLPHFRGIWPHFSKLSLHGFCCYRFCVGFLQRIVR